MGTRNKKEVGLKKKMLFCCRKKWDVKQGRKIAPEKDFGENASI